MAIVGVAEVQICSVTYSCHTPSRAATVDELANGVAVVNKVGGESLVGEAVAVAGDKGLEVVGDGLSIIVAHAVGSGARHVLAAPGVTPAVETPTAPWCGGGRCHKGGNENAAHCVGGVDDRCWRMTRVKALAAGRRPSGSFRT